MCLFSLLTETLTVLIASQLGAKPGCYPLIVFLSRGCLMSSISANIGPAAKSRRKRHGGEMTPFVVADSTKPPMPANGAARKLIRSVVMRTFHQKLMRSLNEERKTIHERSPVPPLVISKTDSPDQCPDKGSSSKNITQKHYSHARSTQAFDQLCHPAMQTLPRHPPSAALSDYNIPRHVSHRMMSNIHRCKYHS